MQEHVGVRYIGNKPTKRDTVAGTITVWHGKGDVQLVERAAAQRLFRYRDVWIPESAAVPQTDTGLSGVRATSAPQPDPASLHERLKLAIAGLGSDGFTDNGRPRKSAVVDALGEDVSVADIAAARDEVQAERAEQNAADAGA
jgi:hypothetical protein